MRRRPVVIRSGPGRANHVMICAKDLMLRSNSISVSSLAGDCAHGHVSKLKAYFVSKAGIECEVAQSTAAQKG